MVSERKKCRMLIGVDIVLGESLLPVPLSEFSQQICGESGEDIIGYERKLR